MDDGSPMECGGNDAALASHALASVPQGAPMPERAEECELPEGWRWAELQEVVTAEKEAVNPLDHPDELFAYYSIPAYQQSDNPALTLGREILSLKLLVEERSVLFGKLNPRVPKVWLVSHKSERRKIASTEFIPLLPKAAETASDFLYYLCWSGNVMPKAQELVSGSTPSRQRVDASSFLEIRVPVPPLPEQRAIAGVLRTVQGAKEACERVLAATRQLKQSLLHHIFTYGPVPFPQAAHVPLKETVMGPMPAHWEVSRLGEVAEIERGKFAHRPRNDPRFYGGSIPFIQTGDVTKSGGRITAFTQTLNELGLSVSRIFPKGTIVLTIAANIGDTAILNFDSAFPDSLVGITPKSGNVECDYLLRFLQTQKVEMDRLAPRGTQKNINIRFLEPWPVALPPPSEQREIVVQLAAVDAKLAALESRRAALAALFQSLLHCLMTGQVRVPLDCGGKRSATPLSPST
jgi:type I restriction enzyme S subunit